MESIKRMNKSIVDVNCVVRLLVWREEKRRELIDCQRKKKNAPNHKLTAISSKLRWREEKEKEKEKEKKNGTIPGELKKINFIIVDHGSC